MSAWCYRETDLRRGPSVECGDCRAAQKLPGRGDGDGRGSGGGWGSSRVRGRSDKGVGGCFAAHDGEVAPTVVCGGSAMAAIFNGNGAMGASDDLERVTKSAVAPRESSLPGKAAALKSEAGKVTGSAVPPAMIAVSNLEMGRGNSRGEARASTSGSSRSAAASPSSSPSLD